MCGACSSVSYCSAQCQRQGWPAHHEDCAAVVRRAELQRHSAAVAIQTVFRGYWARTRLRREQEAERGDRRRAAMVEKLMRGARPNHPETLDWALLAEEHTARKHIRRSLTTVLSGDVTTKRIAGARAPLVIRTVYREWRRVTPVPVDVAPITARDPGTRRGPIGQLRRLADLYFDGFDGAGATSGTEFEFSLVVSRGMYEHLSADELRCLVRLLRNLTEAHSDLLVRLLAEREDLRDTEQVYNATIDGVRRSAGMTDSGMQPLYIPNTQLVQLQQHGGKPPRRSRAGSIKSWLKKTGDKLRTSPGTAGAGGSGGAAAAVNPAAAKHL
jgi:hypothetical protein